MRRMLLTLAALLCCLALTPAAALADHTQLSSFQDDQYLIDSSSNATVLNTLSLLQGLGVQVIRVNVEWDTIAPDPLSTVEPANFNPADPDDYPAVNWEPYDRIVSFAPLFGMQVQFNLTAPGPLWAMGPHSPTTRAANHWEPNAAQFFDFVYAVGERYSGAPYGEPAVTDWSIWNEPNQPGWLAPQSLKVKGREVAQSPRLYRSLVESAYFGLYFSGHKADTILIGETAPEGYETGGFYTAITPLPWLRDLYCVNARFRRLTGTAAKALGCPLKGTTKSFVDANIALFAATGYAHHPYYFFHAPGYSAPDPNFIPIANTGRLERFLDGVFHVYGVRRTLPIYFTEYGYETNPPDPYQVVTPAEQAVYLNEADYMAYTNPRIRSVAQFLLYDSAPNPLYTPKQFDYWDTFQTGLLDTNGDYKPAFFAYRMPIWIPHATATRGASTFVWGQVRPADALPSQAVAIEWRPASGGRYTVLARVRTTAYTGYLTAHVKLPGTGYVKLGWRTPSGATAHSRAAPVNVS